MGECEKILSKLLSNDNEVVSLFACRCNAGDELVPPGSNYGLLSKANTSKIASQSSISEGENAIAEGN
jgi:hypothetical protein